jgi:hypothetical protein
MTLTLRPGAGSGPVSSYEVRVAPQKKLPEDGREVESCPASGTGETTCALAPLKRGDWDVWVRSVGSEPDQVSPWYRGAYGNVSSCTAADGLSGACQKLDRGPGGGIVVYDAGSRQPWGRYLEAATEDIVAANEGKSSFVLCPKSSPDYTNVTNTDAAIGSGRANTDEFLAKCPGSTAASAVQSYRGGGLDDWFLPSKDELEAVYNLRTEVSADSGYRWSSTLVPQDQSGSTQAWYMNFAEVGVDNALSSTYLSMRTGVRAVRYF